MKLVLYEEKGNFDGIIMDHVESTVDTLEDIGIYSVLHRVISPEVRIEAAKYKHVKIEEGDNTYKIPFKKIKSFRINKKRNEQEKDSIFIELKNGETICKKYSSFTAGYITGKRTFLDEKKIFNKRIYCYAGKQKTACFSLRMNVFCFRHPKNPFIRECA